MPADDLAARMEMLRARPAPGELRNVVSFGIIAAVVYFFVVLPVNALMERFRAEEPVGPPQRECPHCLSKIPAAAGRCAFCTQEVPAGTLTRPTASMG